MIRLNNTAGLVAVVVILVLIVLIIRLYKSMHTRLSY